MIPIFSGIGGAQIQMESIDFDTPQIWILPNSPNVVVKIDTINYYLVGVSETDTISNATTWIYHNLDRSWIKNISSPNAFETLEKHGLADVKGVTIIQLNKAGERIFVLNQEPVHKPLKILMYN